MYTVDPNTDTILECLSHSWLPVVLWAASSAVTVAGVTGLVVRFVMGGQIKILEAHISSLESSGDRIDDLNKTIAEHWKTLYESCKSSQSASKNTNRPFLIVSLVLLGAIAGTLLTGFGARVYFAGPQADLQTQLKQEKSQTALLKNTLDQLKAVLPPKAFDAAPHPLAKSAQNLDVVIFAPASLIDAVGNRYKLVAENGRRLHVVVQPIAIQPSDKKRKQSPSDTQEEN